MRDVIPVGVGVASLTQLRSWSSALNGARSVLFHDVSFG